MGLVVTTSREDAGAALAAVSGPVVVVPVYNGFDDTKVCYERILAHTSSDIAILVIDDAGEDRRVVSHLVDMSSSLAHRVVVFSHLTNTGFVGSCNDAFAIADGHDVVLVNSDVWVSEGWLDGLRAAAASSNVIATVSSLTNHGTILSVPERNRPAALPAGVSDQDWARRIAANSQLLRPRIPTAVGHCVYIRRAALDVVGGFDDAFAPGYGEEVDFSLRATLAGFFHVCADDVFTYHRGGTSFGSERSRRLAEAHEGIIYARYPWYQDYANAIGDDDTSALAQALSNARRAVVGLRVAIDALCLGPHPMGTQKSVVQTVRALARHRDIDRLDVYVPRDIPDYARQAVAASERVTLWPVEVVRGRPEVVADVVYRPYQVHHVDDLPWLRQVGERVVVGLLDLIAYDNPGYYANSTAWQTYRELMRLCTAAVDGVTFISQHVLDDIRSRGLVAPGVATRVTRLGNDVDPGAEAVPGGLDADDQGFLLVIGASYQHKNRLGALEAWKVMRHQGWTGKLVLAGPNPPVGSSVAEELRRVADEPFASDLVQLGPVSEDEKHWLYRHAGLVLYPTVVEGFGLVPYEAACYGATTLSTRQGGLDEVLPPGVTTIERFEPGALATQITALLADAPARQQIRQAILDFGERFDWDDVAEELVALFRDVVSQPRNRVVAIQPERPASTGIGIGVRIVDAGAGPMAVGMDRFVERVINAPTLKRVLSPDGSRRQQAARRVIHYIRHSS
jgi:GT2 family glycosyltransferase/glycosyltransferase involved in cell wall biosynthesis